MLLVTLAHIFISESSLDSFCCQMSPQECSLLVIVTRLMCDSNLEWTQVSVALGDFCAFMLDSEMGLLDFPGLEFCWSW